MGLLLSVIFINMFQPQKFLFAFIFFLIGSPLCAGSLEFQFIGNEAFHITDGKTTLLSDFPYTSGAFGYMTYEMKNIKPIVDGVALITHKHQDHWNPKLFSSMALAIMAPPEILAEVKGKKNISFADEMHYKGIKVQAFKTSHTPEHYSYLVTWHGIRMYFPGDTESLDQMLKIQNLDVAFVTPWLISSLKESEGRIDTKILVVYHHQPHETIPNYHDRIVPKQGEGFVIPFKD